MFLCLYKKLMLIPKQYGNSLYENGHLEETGTQEETFAPSVLQTVGELASRMMLEIVRRRVCSSCRF
jgi:hypothetical protein